MIGRVGIIIVGTNVFSDLALLTVSHQRRLKMCLPIFV